MRNAFPVTVCLVLSWHRDCAAAGQQTAGSDLKARADAAQGGERVTLSLDYAHQQLELANKLYSEGDVEKAEAAIGEVAHLFATGDVGGHHRQQEAQADGNRPAGSWSTACVISGSRSTSMTGHRWKRQCRN